jgi:serine O-acetyltransferase
MGVVIGETAEVGDECTIYQGVTLGGTSLHRGAKRHPTLGRGVIIGAGAKVLGGFTVGDGARIGSNAVVVKEVPAGATAVGNPAHIVQKEEQKQREAAAARMFSAYGISSNADDPLSLALQGLINHVATQEHQLKKMMAAMKSAGMSCEQVLDADKFDPEQLNKLVE